MLDKTKVFNFIQANPGARTKAIRKGSGVRNETVTDIFAAGVASGELTAAPGRWGSQTYRLGIHVPENSISVPERETPAAILVPAVQIPLPDLGDALLRPSSGSRAVIDCGQFDAPAPQAPQVNPAEARVLKFIRICHLTSGLTYREIAGGSSLPIAEVKVALESLVQKGVLTSSDEPEPNYRRYRLTAAVPVAEPTVTATLSPAEQALRDAAQQHQVETLAKIPQPKRFEPSEEAVQDELEKRKSVAPLTADERRELELMQGRTPRNPQMVIKR